MDNIKFKKQDPKQGLINLINESLKAGEKDFTIEDFTFGSPSVIKDKAFNTSIMITSKSNKYLGTAVLKFNRVDLKNTTLTVSVVSNSPELNLTNGDVENHFVNSLPYEFDLPTDIALPSTISLNAQPIKVAVQAQSLRYAPGEITIFPYMEKVSSGKIAIKRLSPFYNKNGGPQMNRLNTQLFSSPETFNADAYQKSDLDANKRSKAVFNFGLDGTGIWSSIDDWSADNCFNDKRNNERKRKEMQQYDKTPMRTAELITLIKEQNYYGTDLKWSLRNISFSGCRGSHRCDLHQNEDRVPSITPYYIAGDDGVQYLTYGGDVSLQGGTDDKLEQIYCRWMQYAAHSYLFLPDLWVNEYNCDSIKLDAGVHSSYPYHEIMPVGDDLIAQGNALDLIIIPLRKTAQ